MKNLLVLLAILLPTTVVFSQLTVKKTSSGTDSYIYVTDEVLFVEDDIYLDKNNDDSPTEASIYLRDEAQLIQGSGITDNSGDGIISVYQTIDSTSYYHYTFWNSPVGLATGTGNKNAGVSRLYDVDNITESTQVLTSFAVNGSDGDPITVSTRWIYKMHTSNSTGYPNYVWVGGTDNVEPGYGFLMKGIGEDPGSGYNSQTYDFRGRPNNSDITLTIPAGTKRILTGNPYPSAIDLKAYFWDNNSGILGDYPPGNFGITEILFWDEPKDREFSHMYVDKSGGFGTWIPGAGIGDEDPGYYTPATYKNYNETDGSYGSGTGTGPYVDRRYAPIGQGFVIQTNLGVATDITLKNSHRVFRKIGEVSELRLVEGGETELGKKNSFVLDDGNDPVIPDYPDEDPSYVALPQIRFNVIMNDEYARQLLMVFSDNSTDGYDRGSDARNPMDSGGNEAYFSLEDNDASFVIQTLPFEISKQIPISFSLTTYSKFILKSVETINCERLFREAYLYDSLEGTYQKFTKNKTAIQTLDAGVYEDRFFIVFEDLGDRMVSSGATDAIDAVKASVDFYQNNPYKQMEISNPERYNIESALIYDMSGKLVVNKTNIGTESRFNIATSNLADGVYIIKLTTTDNIDIDYRMIIQNR